MNAPEGSRTLKPEASELKSDVYASFTTGANTIHLFNQVGAIGLEPAISCQMAD